MGKDTQKTTRRTGGGRIRREFSAGGVVHRSDKWLITASAPSKLFPKISWRLPKGWIDEEEKIEDAALREVREEAGVEAKIIKKIGTSFYVYNNPERGRIMKFVTFYLMEYVKDLPEGHDAETSEVVWLDFDEAYKKLSFSGEKQVLKKASELL
ncbi:MAG TPA: NUDIX domain-containing protein [Alphaproteobacteria bacterium]|jgi:8-oxo-dGTP pyrophosphatase MutT (NUDIX family)|nr:NUDIX domain-containing protein [Alphaproteobacteria bacterium]